LRPILFPYSLASDSARRLADRVRCLRVRSDGRYRPRPSDLVVNWGSGSDPISWRFPAFGLNRPSAVSIAANKRLALARFRELRVPSPAWTVSREEARTWS